MMIGFQTDVQGLSGKDNWLEMYTGSDIAPGFLHGSSQQEIIHIGLVFGPRPIYSMERV